MSSIYKLFSGIIPLILLVACATTYEVHEGSMSIQRGSNSPLPELSSEQGRIWFYRNAPRTTPGYWREILLNNKIVAEANPDRVYFVDVQPGTYEVAIDDNEVTITVEKQQHVFIKTEVSIGTWSNQFYPTLVDPNTGKNDLGMFPGN